MEIVFGDFGSVPILTIRDLGSNRNRHGNESPIRSSSKPIKYFRSIKSLNYSLRFRLMIGFCGRKGAERKS